MFLNKCPTMIIVNAFLMHWISLWYMCEAQSAVHETLHNLIKRTVCPTNNALHSSLYSSLSPACTHGHMYTFSLSPSLATLHCPSLGCDWKQYKIRESLQFKSKIPEIKFLFWYLLRCIKLAFRRLAPLKAGILHSSNSELRSCVKVEVVVLGSPFLNSPHGLCGHKATLNFF